MKVIRLSKSQTTSARLTHPVFDNLLVKSDDENRELLEQYLESPSEVLKDEIVRSNLHLVRHTVGRYIAHWTDSRRWEEDMISVGLMTLVERVEKLTPKHAKYFRPWTVTHLKNDIERFLHKSRTSVSPNIMTDYRRLKAGEPIEAKVDVPLTTLGESQ